MPADHLQDLVQPRVPGLLGLLIPGIVQVEEAAAGALLIAAAADDPRPRQVRLIDDGQLAVQPLQRERDPVEGVQGGQQHPAPGKFLGGVRGNVDVMRQREPGGGRKRQRLPGVDRVPSRFRRGRRAP